MFNAANESVGHFWTLFFFAPSVPRFALVNLCLCLFVFHVQKASHKNHFGCWCRLVKRKKATIFTFIPPERSPFPPNVCCWPGTVFRPLMVERFFPGFVVFVCERRKKLRQLVFGLINLLRVLFYEVIVNLFYNRFLIQHRLSFITGRAGMPELSCHHFSPCRGPHYRVTGKRWNVPATGQDIARESITPPVDIDETHSSALSISGRSLTLCNKMGRIIYANLYARFVKNSTEITQLCLGNVHTFTTFRTIWSRVIFQNGNVSSHLTMCCWKSVGVTYGHY